MGRTAGVPARIYFPFFFHDPATTEIYTLSLHDALPILRRVAADQRPAAFRHRPPDRRVDVLVGKVERGRDRKSTRLNSSHTVISYAVFCLKKKSGRDETTSRCRS